MRSNRAIGGVVLSIASAAFGGSGGCLEYDAALGTLPTEQGWDVTLFGERDLTYSVEAGVLHQSSLPFANATCPGPPVQDQYLYWSTSPRLNFVDGVAFEVEAQVLQSEYGINPCEGWARPGLAFSLDDDSGRRFWVGIGESEVFLADSAFLDFGQSGLVEAIVDTTSAFHVYRLEVNGAGAILRIDGLAVLSLPGFGPAEASSAFAWIGDGTTWCNSAVLIRRFALELATCCDADLNGDGIVDGADLGILLGNWGSAGVGDLDGSGTIDGADIGLLLGSWGPCL